MIDQKKKIKTLKNIFRKLLIFIFLITVHGPFGWAQSANVLVCGLQPFQSLVTMNGFIVHANFSNKSMKPNLKSARYSFMFYKNGRAACSNDTPIHDKITSSTYENLSEKFKPVIDEILKRGNISTYVNYIDAIKMITIPDDEAQEVKLINIFDETGNMLIGGIVNMNDPETMTMCYPVNKKIPKKIKSKN